MANSSDERVVVVAMDGSDHSDFAFDCEYGHVAFEIYIYCSKFIERRSGGIQYAQTLFERLKMHCLFIN